MAIKVKDTAKALKALRYMSRKNKICIQNKTKDYVMFQSYCDGMLCRIYVDGQVGLKDYEVVGPEIVDLVNPSTMDDSINICLRNAKKDGINNYPQVVIKQVLSTYPLDTHPEHRVDFSYLFESKLINFKMKTNDFVRMIQLILSTKIRKGTRYDLEYARFILDNGILQGVATDGRTFTQASSNVYDLHLKEYELIFHVKLEVLKKVLYLFGKYKKGIPEKIDIFFYENKCMAIDAQCFDINLRTSDKEDVEYPPYREMLDDYLDKPHTMITVDRLLFLKHLRRTITWMRNQHNMEYIDIKVSDNWIDFFTENNDAFQSYLEIENGFKTSYLIDPKLLEQIISKRQTKDIQIYFRNDAKCINEEHSKIPIIISDDINDSFQEFSLMLTCNI